MIGINTRRSFLQNCVASGVLGLLGWTGRATEPESPTVYPGWRPGEMDLHFIYTGCGENLFYRLPDGTAVLNDVGEFYRPKYLDRVPLLPSSDRLGGEWVSRYLKRVYDEPVIDYAIFSHWHSDHVGHADFDNQKTPEGHRRFRTLPDGRRVNGFLCVAKDFRFRRYLDHQYPSWGMYDSQDSSLELLSSWVRAEQKRGLVVEPFRVGALDQISLLRNPLKYRGVFSVRNLCANGVAWDGRGNLRDFAAEHVKATGAKVVNQNLLSLGFVITYGKFRYFTGGDIQHDCLRDAYGSVNYEAYVARACGPVSVCKMNHHGCTNAMSEEFAKAIRAQVYTSCMWSPSQAHPTTLQMLSGIPSAVDGERPLLVPNLVTLEHWQNRTMGKYKLERLGAMHVVVKVFPGGDAYRVYLLDAANESMRVLATIDRFA